MKRTREESEAYVEVIRKCARLLKHVKDDKEAMLLRPQLQWIERDLDNEALVTAQTPETLQSRLHPMLYDDLVQNQEKKDMLWNVEVKRNWTDTGDDVPPYLSLVATYHNRETREWSGSSFYARDLTRLDRLPPLDASFYGAWGDIVERQKSDRNPSLNEPAMLPYVKMDQELFDIFSWFVYSRKMTVYSSNNAILSLFKD